MELELDEAHRMIRDAVREFVRGEVAPRAAEWEARAALPREILRQAAGLGLLGAMVPPEYGGAGLDTLGFVVALEELAAGDGSLALTLAAHNSLCCGHLLLAGSEPQKARFLPPLAAGELGAWALTEPGAGSDASGTRTEAVRRGDRWVLNGSKTFITNGSEGRTIVLMARTSHAHRERGISAFVVEQGTPGLSARRMGEKLGMQASDTAELHLEDVELPAEQLLGREGEGFIDTLRVLDGGRVGIGALAIGLARAGLERSLRYCQERRQFGRMLAEFQATQFALADMATRLDAARLLVYRAAWLKDTGRRFTREASMAKLWASEAAMWTAWKAVQLHGGYGYSRELPLERHLRDVKLCEIGEGTSEIQRLVIARSLLEEAPA